MAHLIVPIVENHVIPQVQEELKLIGKVDKEIEDLSSSFKEIQKVLKIAEESQQKDVEDWLAKLKSVSYKVDDVLDEWRTQNLRRKDQDHRIRFYSFIQGIICNSCTSAICLVIENNILGKMFLSFPWENCWIRYDIGHQIVDIKKELDEVLQKKEELKLEQSSVEKPEITESCNPFSKNRDPEGFIGREGDKKDIITKLMNMNRRSIISITGKDGVGKTNLAGHVCNDEQVQKHFQTIIWMNVPTPFDQQKLAQKTFVIKRSPTIYRRTTSSPVNSFDELTQLFSKKLVLLVLDDAREDYNDKSWSSLKRLFEKSAEGSKVLVTSYRKAFANKMQWGWVDAHQLHELRKEDSRELFDSIAFRFKDENLAKEVQDIRHEIVDKCEGLPQAVKAVAGLLYSCNTRHEWEMVLQSNIWKSEGFMKEVFPALRLGYSELPPHLKGGFAYCAIFQEDDRIYKDELVKLWMAQGLVPYSSDNPETEATGELYVSKLEKRSFFQDLEKGEDGETISFRIHKTTHEFVRHITNQEFAILKMEDFNSNTHDDHHLLRHLTLLCGDDEAMVIPSSFKAEGLRTLRVQPIGCRSKLDIDPPQLFSLLKRLRALDLSKSDIEQLPVEVEKLIHLRYLNLSETRLEKLPETVCTLYNLQTLRLNKCDDLVELPQGIGQMKNLRHLEISETKKLKCLPQGIGRLTSLRTLTRFIVSGDDRGRCNIGELRALRSIHGCLEIHVIEKVQAKLDEVVAKKAKMENKGQLRELKLEFEANVLKIDEKEEKRLKGFIKGLLQLPQKLEKLQILAYPGTSFPNFVRTEDAAIKVLRLHNFRICTQLSPIGKLKHLRELEIVGMKELINIDLEFFGDMEGDQELMPDLRFLKLQDCPKLKGPLCLLQCLKLTKLDINNCPQLEWPTSSPLQLPELEYLYLFGNAGVLTESLSAAQIHLPKLKYLLINGSPHSSLPQGLGQFNELQTLEIMCCSEIHSLPHELKDLRNLQEMRINTCPKLSSRCQKEDWVKISGGTNIIIDSKKINRDRNLRAKDVPTQIKSNSRSKIPQWSKIHPQQSKIPQWSRLAQTNRL